MRIRPALPLVPLAHLVAGHDTTLQAAENRRRVAAYVERLRRDRLPLPGLPHLPGRLDLPAVVRESGVGAWALRPGGPARRALEDYGREAGHALIARTGWSLEEMSVRDVEDRLGPLVPRLAARRGLKPEAMRRAVDELAGLLRKRAGGRGDMPAAPLLARLDEEGRRGDLALSARALELLGAVPALLAEVDAAGPDLDDMDFADLLAVAVARIGLPPTRLARELGVHQTTFWKWLNLGRAPVRRHFPALREIARLAALPEDALTGRIRRDRAGDGWRLSLADYPEEYRGRSHEALRRSVRRHLSRADALLDRPALLRRIAALCRELDARRARNRARKRMRDANRIDRRRFSAALREDIAELARRLGAELRLREATVAAYVGHVEMFFGFALSDRCPEPDRLAPEAARLTHLAAIPLWRGLLAHLNAVGAAEMGPDFRIARAHAERMKFVIGMFEPDEGYFARHPASHAALVALAFPGLEAPADPRARIGEGLRRLGGDLKAQLAVWRRQSRAPVTGRSEIADLLARPDPRIAVQRMIAHQRAALERISPLSRSVGAAARAEGLSRDTSMSYAIGLRRLCLLHVLGQTGLRVGTLVRLTVGPEPRHHLQWTEGGAPVLRVPRHLFKNERGLQFASGRYERVLEDLDGCWEDLRLYLTVGRPRLLDGDETCEALFVAGGAGPRGPQDGNNLRAEIGEISRAAIGADAPADRRLIFGVDQLKPHHFRDILATYVLQATGRDYALAGDAIHVSAATCLAHYGHDTPEMRRNALEAVLRAPRGEDAAALGERRLRRLPEAGTDGPGTA